MAVNCAMPTPPQLVPKKIARELESIRTVADLVDFVDMIKAGPRRGDSAQLSRLLDERHPVFDGKAAGTVVRLRGYVMAALEWTRLDTLARAYIFEALETSTHPYLVAAAARALRGEDNIDLETARCLLNSFHNIWRHDEPINFDSYHSGWPLHEFTTAVSEILSVLGRVGPSAQVIRQDLLSLRKTHAHRLRVEARAGLDAAIGSIPAEGAGSMRSCCAIQPTRVQGDSSVVDDPRPLEGVVLEDQDGRCVKWGEFFEGSLSVVAFFYTRCSNPWKCTRTIQTLVDIQRVIVDQGWCGRVRTAAITYDATYDTSRTLRSYGDARRFMFGENHRMFRIPEAFGVVTSTLGLGVSYAGSQVNQHRVECFVLDEAGAVSTAFVRERFSAEQICAALAQLY